MTFSLSRDDLKSAFLEGQAHSSSFKGLLQTPAFRSHPELYSVAQEILNTKGEKPPSHDVIVRVYSVLTSKNVDSLPKAYQLLSKWTLSNSIAECENTFKRDFDSFFTLHSTLTTENNQDSQYINEHLKDHFKDIKARFKNFDSPTEKNLNTDWSILQTALMHDDFSTAKASWNRILETCISNFWDKDYLKQEGCDLKYLDKEGAEIALKSGIQSLVTYLKSSVQLPHIQNAGEYEEFELVSEDIGQAEEQNERVNEQIKHQHASSQYGFEVLNAVLEKSPTTIKEISLYLTELPESHEIDTFCNLLPQCNHLETLTLSISTISDADAKKIAKALLNNPLREINLVNIKNPTVLDAFLKQLKTAPNLERLEIQHYRPIEMLSQSQMTLIMDLIKNSQNRLKDINLNDTTVSYEAQLSLLKELSHFSNTTLTFSKNLVRDDFVKEMDIQSPKHNIQLDWERAR